MDVKDNERLSFLHWISIFLIDEIPIIGDIALLIWFYRGEGIRKQYSVHRLILKLIFDILDVLTLVIIVQFIRVQVSSLAVYISNLT